MFSQKKAIYQIRENFKTIRQLSNWSVLTYLHVAESSKLPFEGEQRVGKDVAGRVTGSCKILIDP
jgi:hypothetical protein